MIFVTQCLNVGTMKRCKKCNHRHLQQVDEVYQEKDCDYFDCDYFEVEYEIKIL